MQSNRARLAVLAAAIVVAGVLFVILSGNDEDQGAPSTTAVTSESVDRTPGGGQPQGGESEGAKPLPTITVKDGQPKGGVQELSAQSGGEVRFRVVSDDSAEVHVHGYDLEKEVTPGNPATLRFPAEIEGRFEVELHLSDGNEVEIGELSVTPS
jgi:hypothetical protein